MAMRTHLQLTLRRLRQRGDDDYAIRVITLA
jgi:hypothetical protein